MQPTLPTFIVRGIRGMPREIQNPRLKPVFHSRISPPLAKNFDKEIIFLHSFAAEEICSPATVA
jgi:hypothetical protein